MLYNEKNNINNEKERFKVKLIKNLTIIVLIALLNVMLYLIAVTHNATTIIAELFITVFIIIVLSAIFFIDSKTYHPTKSDYEGIFYILTQDKKCIILKIFSSQQKKIKELKDEPDLKHVLKEIILKEIEPQDFNDDNYIYYDKIRNIKIEYICEITKVHNIQSKKYKTLVEYDCIDMIYEIHYEHSNLVIEEGYNDKELLINTLKKLQ